MVAILDKVRRMTQNLIEAKVKTWMLGFLELPNNGKRHLVSSYWMAGAMYRGNPPSPLLVDHFCPLNAVSMKVIPSFEYPSMIQLPKTMLVEAPSNTLTQSMQDEGCISAPNSSFNYCVSVLIKSWYASSVSANMLLED